MKRMLMFAALVIFAALTASAATPKVDLVQGENKIDVNIDGKLFTSYIYGDQLPKPSLIHIKTPSGIEVSRRYPLTELEGGSDDHLHHVGLFFTVDQVNGTNFWNNTSSSPQIKHIETKQAVGGQDKGTLETISHWIDKNGQVVLEDNRTIAFITGENDGEYAIDYTVELTAKADKVVFEDTEEGVFAIRLSDYLREPKRGKRVEPDKEIPAQSVKGTSMYFSSNGDKMAKGVWGKRARWIAIQGVKDDKVVGVAILNHPESLNYPTYWHARNYGLFSANPLGQGDFQRQDDYEKNEPIYLNYTLKKGQTAHFRFKVIIYEGVKNQEQIEQRFKEFVK
jgi:hypothetical protein